MTKYKPIEELNPGDIAYRVHDDGNVSLMTVKEINLERLLIYFVDSLYNIECYGVIRIHKSHMRLSGTNNSVYSSKEETKECLEKKIRYINKQIEKLEKL